MKTKEYRTWRIIILVFNILVHVGIFLSLTNFRISDLRKSYPSYFEFSSFSEGKGSNPNLTGGAKPQNSAIEKTEIQIEKKIVTDPEKVVRVENDGIKIFSDSVQNQNKIDSVKAADSFKMDGIAGDTTKKEDSTAMHAGSGFGNGTGDGTNADIQMPRFMNGDYNEFSNWVYRQYNLYAENFSGTVVVEFRVTYNGEVKDVNITNCNNRKIKAELMRIISNSPKWIPAKNRNRPKDIIFTIPFNFSMY
jgi:outer membrane biosynthesis protein TonB